MVNLQGMSYIFSILNFEIINQKVALAQNRTSKNGEHHATPHLPGKCFKHKLRLSLNICG